MLNFEKLSRWFSFFSPISGVTLKSSSAAGNPTACTASNSQGEAGSRYPKLAPDVQQPHRCLSEHSQDPAVPAPLQCQGSSAAGAHAPRAQGGSPRSDGTGCSPADDTGGTLQIKNLMVPKGVPALLWFNRYTIEKNKKVFHVSF